MPHTPPLYGPQIPQLFVSGWQQTLTHGPKTHVLIEGIKEKSYHVKRKMRKWSEKEWDRPFGAPEPCSVGEISPCPGCNTEMTRKMMKYVWNLCRIHICVTAPTLAHWRKRDISSETRLFKNKKNKHIMPSFTWSWCSWRKRTLYRFYSRSLKWADLRLRSKANAPGQKSVTVYFHEVIPLNQAT